LNRLPEERALPDSIHGATLSPSGLPSPEREDLARIADRLSAEFGEMAGKRILITGGAGFLGYYLVRSVLYWNALKLGSPIEVVVFDNFQRGVPKWLEEIGETAELKLVRHDITEPLPEDLPGFHYIIHAASIASPTFYRKNPIETMDANVLGLRNLLELCRGRVGGQDEVEGFLFFSTSEIYGDPVSMAIPTPETYAGNVSCTGPRACYDESKRYGETLCVNFYGQHGVPARIVRPFNNYGPGLKLDDGRLLSDFANCVLHDRDIVMFSDGSPTRTFCYISDAIIGYYKVLLRGRDGEPYNIGSDGPEVSVGEVAEQVTALAQEMFAYEGRVVRQVHEDRNYLVDNPNRRCPNIDKARAEFRFEPEVGLEEGLRKMLLWYRGTLGTPSVGRTT